MGLPIRLSASDGVPIYLQIVTQVRYMIAAGQLGPGEELPPIRALAEQLMVNPNTVARAYRELEIAGLVAKRRASGTYVSDGGSPLARRARLEILADRIDALLAEARALGVTREELLDLIERRQEALDGREEALRW